MDFIRKYFIEIVILATAIIIALFIMSQSSSNVGKLIRGLDEYNEFQRVVDEEIDLIWGNPNAELFIVEYGDLQCQYCQQFHHTMREFMNGVYGLSGRVAWVWRNGPHINDLSIKKSQVVDCVKKYSPGNKRQKNSWQFISDSLSIVDEEEYPIERYSNIFTSLDLNPITIENCRLNNETKEDLERTIRDVINFNIVETPYLQYISKDGELLHESTGAVGIETLREVVEKIFEVVEAIDS